MSWFAKSLFRFKYLVIDCLHWCYLHLVPFDLHISFSPAYTIDMLVFQQCIWQVLQLPPMIRFHSITSNLQVSICIWWRYMFCFLYFRGRCKYWGGNLSPCCTLAIHICCYKCYLHHQSHCNSCTLPSLSDKWRSYSQTY